MLRLGNPLRQESIVDSQEYQSIIDPLASDVMEIVDLSPEKIVMDERVERLWNGFRQNSDKFPRGRFELLSILRCSCLVDGVSVIEPKSTDKQFLFVHRSFVDVLTAALAFHFGVRNCDTETVLAARRLLLPLKTGFHSFKYVEWELRDMFARFRLNDTCRDAFAHMSMGTANGLPESAQVGAA